MSKKKDYKKNKKALPEENKNLPGFDIHINPFGKVQSTYDIDEVNSFLNENLTDKKLKNKNLRNQDKSEKKESEE